MIKKDTSVLNPNPLHADDAFTYETKGIKERSGYADIRNLFSLIKADFKEALKEYGLCIPKRSEKLKEIQSLVIPFNAFWKEWSASGFCNLTLQEVLIINLYRKKQDYEWIGQQLGISYDVASSNFAKAVKKLKSPETAKVFQKWKDFKHLDISNPEDFLDIPLEGLRHVFPSRVHILLAFFGENMREVLNKMTLKDLRKYRNFGNKAEQELREVLNKYQCLHLLK